MGKQSIGVVELEAVVSRGFLLVFLLTTACGTFHSSRLTTEEFDRRAAGVTDKWVPQDTLLVLKDIRYQLDNHRGLEEYRSNLGRRPKLLVGEIKNQTAEVYFPVEDLLDAFLTDLSSTNDYILLEGEDRDKILQELQQQSNVDYRQIKKMGKFLASDLLILGAIHMKPETRNGKTIKNYSINLRVSDLETGQEVARLRSQVNKYSTRSRWSW
jgi:hypothetical protein